MPMQLLLSGTCTLMLAQTGTSMAFHMLGSDCQFFILAENANYTAAVVWY